MAVVAILSTSNVKTAGLHSNFMNRRNILKLILLSPLAAVVGWKVGSTYQFEEALKDRYLYGTSSRHSCKTRFLNAHRIQDGTAYRIDESTKQTLIDFSRWKARMEQGNSPQA